MSTESNLDGRSRIDADRDDGVHRARAEIVGILDTVEIPIVVVSRDCTLVRFNRAAAETLGLAASDLGRRPADIVALAIVKDLQDVCSRVMADETPYRRDIRIADRWFMLRVAPYVLDADVSAGVVLTFTNVTAFRASLEQAIYEREYTKAILNTVSTPLVVLNADLLVQSANRAFYGMFGVSRDNAQGVPLVNLARGGWQTPDLWSALEATLFDKPFEPAQVDCDFPHLGRRSVLLDARRLAGHRDVAILLAIQDITELKRSEEKLKEADRRKDEFLALLAHELRNPLAPIRTGLELIRISGDTPQAVGRVRPMMDRQINHLVRLIDDLLDVSRIASGKIVLQPAPTPVTELVHGAIETHRGAIDAAGIHFTLDLPSQPCFINADSTRFVQIVSNVLHNAVKFTPAGGTIDCRVETSQDASVTISIADSGSGISHDMLPRIFELFTQAEPATGRTHGGLGIGLALARRLLEMHGGDIVARSEGPGRGSMFIITMPVCGPPAAGVLLSQVDDACIPSRVVIIDDNEDAATTMSMLIEELGGQTRTAKDASSGLQAVAEFEPDIVFLDIGMPGIDGYEACRRMRQSQAAKQFVLVALTGWGQSHDKQRAFDAGFDAHLTKPVDSVSLMHLLSGRARDTRKREGSRQ